MYIVQIYTVISIISTCAPDQTTYIAPDDSLDYSEVFICIGHHFSIIMYKIFYRNNALQNYVKFLPRKCPFNMNAL